MPQSFSSSNLLPIILITGCVGATAGLFFVLRAHRMETEAASKFHGKKALIEVPQPAPETPPAPLPAPPAPPTNTLPEPLIASDPTELVSRMVKAFVAGDAATMLSLAPQAISAKQATRIATAFHSGQLAIDEAQPVSELATTDGSRDRWAINTLRLPKREAETFVISLTKRPDQSWQIHHMDMPAFLADQPKRQDEAIAAAGAFFEALKTKDFAKARAFASETGVPNEKLAALGILIEEANFEPQPQTPFVVTTTTEDSAWVIARMVSTTYNLRSELGLELVRNNETWQLERVNLSEIMREFLKASRNIDALEMPLVENPQGGESIALYFGYDDAEISQRSLGQLAIIAGILKTSPERKIEIAGHTDALGEDAYNDRLSENRASRVAQTLRQLGVHSTQIITKSYGERQPLSPNTLPDGTDNPDGRKRNRRTEIYLDF